MQKSRKLKLLFTGTLLGFLVGCLTPIKIVTDLPPTALESGKSVAIVYALDCAERVGLSGRCAENSELKNGGKFVTDPPNVSILASNVGKHEELRAAVAKLDVTNVLQSSTTKHLKPLFESAGLSVTINPIVVRAWSFPARAKHSNIKFGAYHRDTLENDEARTGSAVSLNPDYQPVIEELNTDYLLVIDLLRYDIFRKYAPIVSVALEPPTAGAAIRATLFRANVAEPLYDNIISRRRVPDFEWKTPPDFDQLMALPPLVLDMLMEDAAREFFNKS